MYYNYKMGDNKSKEERQREINTKYFEGQMFIAEACSTIYLSISMLLRRSSESLTVETHIWSKLVALT